jgi:hypothetical protein
VGPRTGLDDVAERKFLTLPGLELRPLCRPARSQWLSRLLNVTELTLLMLQELRERHVSLSLYSNNTRLNINGTRTVVLKEIAQARKGNEPKAGNRCSSPSLNEMRTTTCPCAQNVGYLTAPQHLDQGLQLTIRVLGAAPLSESNIQIESPLG